MQRGSSATGVIPMATAYNVLPTVVMQCSAVSQSVILGQLLKLAGWAPPWIALPCQFALSISSLAVLDGMMELEASSFPAQIRLTAGAPVKSQGGSRVGRRQ